MSTRRREPVGIAVVSKINGTAVNSRVFAFPFIVSTQGCKLNMISFLVVSATFSNISAISGRSVLVVEETGVPGENHRPWASNSTQGCKLNRTAVNSFTLKQFTTARCNQKGSIIIFQYCVPLSSNFGYYLVKEIMMNDMH
jgi:hypothetical protein